MAEQGECKAPKSLPLGPFAQSDISITNDKVVFDALCLDGGGVRGYFQLLYLKQQVRDILNVRYVFGTSIGGIIGLEIARLLVETNRDAVEVEKGIDRLISLFRDEGESMFKLNSILPFSSYGSSVYTPKNLKAKMQSWWGDRTLACFNQDDEKGTPKIKVFITSFDFSRMKPTVFRNSSKLHTPIKLIDVALATSAAPTYFPLHSVRRRVHRPGQHIPVQHTAQCACQDGETVEVETQMIDGGVWANNPLPLLVSYQYQCRDIKAVLSLGTGVASDYGSMVFNPVDKDEGLRFWMVKGSDKSVITNGYEHPGLLVTVLYSGHSCASTRNVATFIRYSHGMYMRRVNFKMPTPFALDDLSIVEKDVIATVIPIIRDISSRDPAKIDGGFSAAVGGAAPELGVDATAEDIDAHVLRRIEEAW